MSAARWPRSGLHLAIVVSAQARRAFVAALVVGIATVGFGAAPAWAHISLADSDPQNISTVDEPVERVRLTFSGEADPATDKFVIEGPSGEQVPVASIEPDGDGNVLIVTPSQPLAGGRHRVTWAIRSGDAHTMNGTIAFTVTAAAAATGPGASAPTTVGVTPAATGDTTTGSPSLAAESTAGIARWLVYASLLFCIGGLGYLVWVHRGTASEGRRLVHLIRRAALVVGVGAVAEFAAQVVVFDGGSPSALLQPAAWAEAATASFGTGTALRIVGAVLVLTFLRIDLDHTFILDGHSGFDELSAADLALLDDSAGSVATQTVSSPPLLRLRVEASPVAFVGAALLVASEAFIGHTATTDPRLAIVLSDAGHLIGAGIWASGAVMLAVTIGRRHGRGQPLDARLLATRFSAIAGWALAAVAATGVVLGWGILGEISALWSTAFGRVLVAKVVVVGVIAGIGTYNHKVLVPALHDGGEDTEHRFRRTVTTEAALFGVVLVLTALLVASSTI